MRQNKIGRKNLGFYTTYKITGLNLDNLVNILKNKGVNLHDIVKTGRKTLIVSVSLSDTEKFFAITREMCYNIKKVGERGKYRVALKLTRNLGIIIGAVIFAVFSVIINDFVFSVDYYGSGSVYAREINALLASENVKPFSRFSEINLPALSDKILEKSDKISFAECSKVGNRLKINLVLSEKPIKTLVGDKETLISDIDGEIEYIKVYRGMALKAVGEKINAGDAIIGGYAVIKDITVKVGIIATVSVKGEFIYVYESEKDGDENLAVIFAEIALGEREIISAETVKTVREDNLYEYKVKIVYRKIFYG